MGKMVWIAYSSDDRDKYIIGVFTSIEEAHKNKCFHLSMWELDTVSEFDFHFEDTIQLG